MHRVWHVDKYKITFKLFINRWTNEIFVTWHLLHRCYLGVLGTSFSTHSRILFSSEYFHYKIFINEKCLENWNYKYQENLSRPGIIDARVRYGAAARRLRNTVLGHMVHFINGRIALNFEESKDFLRRARGKMVKMEGDTWELSEHM